MGGSRRSQRADASGKRGGDDARAGLHRAGVALPPCRLPGCERHSPWACTPPAGPRRLGRRWYLRTPAVVTGPAGLRSAGEPCCPSFGPPCRHRGAPACCSGSAALPQRLGRVGPPPRQQRGGAGVVRRLRQFRLRHERGERPSLGGGARPSGVGSRTPPRQRASGASRGAVLTCDVGDTEGVARPSACGWRRPAGWHQSPRRPGRALGVAARRRSPCCRAHRGPPRQEAASGGHEGLPGCLPGAGGACRDGGASWEFGGGGRADGAGAGCAHAPGSGDHRSSPDALARGLLLRCGDVPPAPGRAQTGPDVL
mmetsp:Transcript_18936/g.59446  ORF Transcript_18936/g.59446 Transcript_18936/m.59446 type:complete len:312 (+) Transcript_18936:697-1632(+)